MKKPEIVIEQSPNGDRFLTIGCPDCGTTNRYPFPSLEPDAVLECSCGVGFNFSQKNFDELKENYGLEESEEKTN